MQKLQQKTTNKSVFAIKTLISCGTLCLLLLLPHAVHAWMPDVRPDLQPSKCAGAVD